MSQIAARVIAARKIVASTITAGLAGIVRGLRWYLHWAGVNEYAQHSTWNMSGFGDVVSETITPAAPGTGDQYLWANSDASWGLYIDDSTGDLILDYVDVDGSTARTITGPALSAGETVSYSIEFAADGVTMTVGATDYTNANTPELGSIVYLSANNTPASYFQGTRENLRYTNATALQSTPTETKRAVMGNGVDLYGTMGETTLSGDLEIEFDWVKQLPGGYVGIVGTASGTPSDSYIMVDSSNGTLYFRSLSQVIASAFTSAFADYADGQHVHVKVSRVGANVTLTLDGVEFGTNSYFTTAFKYTRIWKWSTSNPLPTNSTIQNLKITDKSGAEDVVYQYDLSGDSGSNIPITIDGVASTPGTWQNYDQGTDQVALPVLSRNYKMKDGPDATALADSLHPDGSKDATLFNVDPADWDRSKT